MQRTALGVAIVCPVGSPYTHVCRLDWTSSRRAECADPIQREKLRVLSLERANPLALDPTQGRTMRVPRSLASRAVVAAASASFALSGIAAPALADGERNANRTFVQTNLVSDVPGLAAHTDPNLRNSWGTSTGPGLPIWVSDNASGVTTLYDGQGNPQPGSGDNQLVVTIPAPPSAGPGAVGAPDGTVFNPTASGFVVSKNGVSDSARFLFATEDGTIAGWSPNVDPTHAVLAVDRSTVT